jgi:hypothetical protein
METGRVNRPTQRSSTQPAQPAPPEPPAQEAPPPSARRASPSPQLEPLAISTCLSIAATNKSATSTHAETASVN